LSSDHLDPSTPVVKISLYNRPLRTYSMLGIFNKLMAERRRCALHPDLMMTFKEDRGK
jgi:hypothetical protein